jgi:pimeloyl-ACP methyl ester carboxylesterase
MPVLAKESLRIDYADDGQGPPVVLIHSSVSANRQWRLMIEALKDRYRVLATNLFGYGETTPRLGDAPQTLHARAGLVVALREGAGAPVHLVGHSFGGSVASRVASLPGPRVGSLVLLEPNPFYLLGQGGGMACLAVVLALAVASTAGSSRAADIAIDTEREGEAISIRASTALDADAATAWHVLTDYDHYSDFIPDLRSSRVVARRGGTVTVEQSGDAALWFLKLPLDITFEIKESPPGALQSRAVAGSLRALTSNYTLTPDAGGVRFEYAGRITLGLALLGHFEQKVVERNIARQFQALADEIEKRARAARSPAMPGISARER